MAISGPGGQTRVKNFRPVAEPWFYRSYEIVTFVHNHWAFRYLFNLEPGEYLIEIISYLYSVGQPSVQDGTKWLVKAVGKDVEIERIWKDIIWINLYQLSLNW